MAQLVNQNCARCSERICDDLDSRFCWTCGNPVHKACAVPGADEGTCLECGSRKDRPIAAQVLAERAEDEREPRIVDPTAPRPPAKLEPPSTMQTVIVVLYSMPLILLLRACFRQQPEPFKDPEPDPAKAAIRVAMCLFCVGLALFLQLRENRKKQARKADEQAGRR